jgi:hypothetical protein
MTSLGLLIMNKGEAMTGKGKWAKAAGSFDMRSPVRLNIFDRGVRWLY